METCCWGGKINHHISTAKQCLWFTANNHTISSCLSHLTSILSYERTVCLVSCRHKLKIRRFGDLPYQHSTHTASAAWNSNFNHDDALLRRHCAVKNLPLYRLRIRKIGSEVYAALPVRCQLINCQHIPASSNFTIVTNDFPTPCSLIDYTRSNKIKRKQKSTDQLSAQIRFTRSKKLADSGLVLPELEKVSKSSFCFLLKLVGVSTWTSTI